MPGSWEKAVAAWRASLDESRRAPYGWLSLAGLDFLEEGENPVGSEAGSRVTLPFPAPPRAGSIIVDGGRLFFTPEPGADVRLRREPVSDTIELSVDDERASLESLGVRFFALRREGRWCVRIKDPNAATRKHYPGAVWFEPKREWVVEARFRPSDAMRVLRVPNALGGVDESPCPGVVEFEAGGATRSLAVMGREDAGFFLVFGDATNGKETYPPGRFLTTDPPKMRKVTLDFNRAHNPPCALTPYATCPYPPAENKLPIPVPAGERFHPRD